jgi:hypothetical protein
MRIVDNAALAHKLVRVLDHGFMRLVEYMDDMPNKMRRFRIPALEKKVAFLKRLREIGSIIAVCKEQRLSRYSVIQWRRKDSVFDGYVHEVTALWRGANGVRICQVCTDVKSLDEFMARSDRSGQQRSTCRECYRRQGRASYWRNRENAFFRHKANRARSRSQSLRVPCDVTADFLESIWTGVCPVFGIYLVWNASRTQEDAPELDRIIPSLGYVKGNVVWLSRRANRLKNNVSAKELRQLLQWLESANLKEALPCAA